MMIRLAILLFAAFWLTSADAHARCVPLTTVETLIQGGASPEGEDLSDERKVQIYEKWAEYKLCMAYTTANSTFCIKSDTTFPTQPCEKLVGVMKRAAALNEEEWSERLQLTDQCDRLGFDSVMSAFCVALVSRDANKCNRVSQVPYRPWCKTFVQELGPMSYSVEQWATKGVVAEADKKFCDRSDLQSDFTNWVAKGARVDDKVWDFLSFDGGTFSACDGSVYMRFRFHRNFLAQLKGSSHPKAKAAYNAYYAWKNPDAAKPETVASTEEPPEPTGPTWQAFLDPNAFPSQCPSQTHNKTMYIICQALKVSESQSGAKCELLRGSDTEQRWGKPFCMAVATGDGSDCEDASRAYSRFATEFGVSASVQKRVCETWNRRDSR